MAYELASICNNVGQTDQGEIRSRRIPKPSGTSHYKFYNNEVQALPFGGFPWGVPMGDHPQSIWELGGVHPRMRAQADSGTAIRGRRGPSVEMAQRKSDDGTCHQPGLRLYHFPSPIAGAVPDDTAGPESLLQPGSSVNGGSDRRETGPGGSQR